MGRIRTGKVPATIVSLAILAAASILILLARGPAGLVDDALDAANRAAAEDLAQEALRDLSPSTCFEEAIIDWDTAYLFEQADALPSGDRWLPDGSLVWVGQVTEAIVSLEGELIASEPGEVWVMVTEDGTPVVVRLQEIESPSGKSLWAVASKARAVPDRQCKE